MALARLGKDGQPSSFNQPVPSPRTKMECFSIEDLVNMRPATAVVNPWLSRWVILCKDASGRVGIRVNTYNKGVFVSLVTAGSPAAMAGLRWAAFISLTSYNYFYYTIVYRTRSQFL